MTQYSDLYIFTGIQLSFVTIYSVTFKLDNAYLPYQEMYKTNALMVNIVDNNQTAPIGAV